MKMQPLLTTTTDKFSFSSLIIFKFNHYNCVHLSMITVIACVSHVNNHVYSALHAKKKEEGGNERKDVDQRKEH